MKLSKVVHRIARMGEEPEVLPQVARDIGAGLAAGERDALERVGRELAIHAPHRLPPARATAETDSQYWAGYAAALGTLLAAERAASEKRDAREAALRHARPATPRAVLEQLAEGPATGAELAARLGLTASAVSKALTHLRGAGLARPLGGEPYPKRGARKPHVPTPLGAWAIDELRRPRRTGDEATANA